MIRKLISFYKRFVVYKKIDKALKKKSKKLRLHVYISKKKIETQSFNPLINVFSLFMVYTLYNGTLRATKSFATYLANFFCYES